MFITPASTVTLMPAASGCFCSCGFPFSLQAVETNLASKDSHWVFVNEVGAQKGEGVPSLSLPPLGKVGMSFSRPVLTWGAAVDSRLHCAHTGGRRPARTCQDALAGNASALQAKDKPSVTEKLYQVFCEGEGGWRD